MSECIADCGRVSIWTNFDRLFHSISPSELYVRSFIYRRILLVFILDLPSSEISSTTEDVVFIYSLILLSVTYGLFGSGRIDLTDLTISILPIYYTYIRIILNSDLFSRMFVLLYGYTVERDCVWHDE